MLVYGTYFNRLNYFILIYIYSRTYLFCFNKKIKMRHTIQHLKWWYSNAYFSSIYIYSTSSSQTWNTRRSFILFCSTFHNSFLYRDYILKLHTMETKLSRIHLYLFFPWKSSCITLFGCIKPLALCSFEPNNINYPNK